MDSFPQFIRLPLEMQREIWKSALEEEPEPGLSIFGRSQQPLWPLTVDVVFDPLMHVCRESRAMARSHLRFRIVEDGACFCPYRDFRFDHDILWLHISQCYNFFTRKFLDSWPQSAELRHLAVDNSWCYVTGDQPIQLASHLGRFGSLRTLSITFMGNDIVPLAPRPYRLEDFVEGETVWTSQPFRVKRADVDPKVISEWVAQYLDVANVEDWATAPYDDNGHPLFNVISRKLVRKHRLNRAEGNSWLARMMEQPLSTLRQYLT